MSHIPWLLCSARDQLADFKHRWTIPLFKSSGDPILANFRDVADVPQIKELFIIG